MKHAALLALLMLGMAQLGAAAEGDVLETYDISANIGEAQGNVYHDGELYVVDKQDDNVEVYDESFNHKRTAVDLTNANSDFSGNARAIERHDGSWYIGHDSNGYIYEFDDSWNYVTRYQSNCGINIDIEFVNGNVYIVGNGGEICYSPDDFSNFQTEDVSSEIGNTRGIFWNGQYFYVISTENDIHRYDSNLNFVNEFTANSTLTGQGHMYGTNEWFFSPQLDASKYYKVEADNQLNNPPEFNSSSVSPDPPLIGETVSYSAEAYDSDGSISDLELTVFQDGSQVYQSSVSSSSNTWSDVHTVEEGEVAARFVATDDAGASTVEWLNRTLTESAPATPTINSPDGGTFNDESIEYDIDTFSDGDDNSGETLTLTLKEDGSQVAQTTVTESGTATGSYTTSGEGSHNFDVIVEEADGETSSASSTYTVDFIDPTVDSISTTPTTWNYQDDVDVTVDASDNTEVSEVCVKVLKDGTTYISQKCRITSSSSVSETWTDLFTVDATNSDYTVEVTVTDNQGGTGTSSTTQTVENDAPSASASFNPSTWNYQDQPDVSYQFSDPNGNFDYGEIVVYKNGNQIQSYTRSDLSGTISSAFTVDETNSDYSVNLTAYDLQGATGEYAEHQYVDNQAPTASASFNPSSWTYNDKVDISYEFSDPNGNIDTRSITVTKDGNQIASYSPSQNSGTISDAFTIDETGSTYEVTLQATDLKGQTGTSSTSQTVTNTAPSVSISSTPSQWFYGDSIDLSYSLTDNENDAVTKEIRVYEAGNKIKEISLSNQSGTISNVFDIDMKDTDYIAQIYVEDSDGQSDTESISQTITDNFGTLSLSSPTNQTYFSYNNNVEFSHSDSDRVPGEDWNCDVNRDGQLYESVYLKEGTNNSYSGVVRSDLGQHTLEVECSDPAGNTGTASENYEVKAFEITANGTASPAYETQNTGYQIDVKTGEMTNNVETRLNWNNTQVNTETQSSNGIETLSFSHVFQPPLTPVNNTDYSWNFDVQANITDFNDDSSTSTLTESTTPGTQALYWNYWNASIQNSKDRVIEKEDFNASLLYDTHGSPSANVSGTISFNGSTENTLEARFDPPLINESSVTETVSGELQLEFGDSERSLTAATDSVDIHRKILTDCSTAVYGVTGDKALDLTLYNEENRSQKLTGDINYNFDTTHHGEHTRNYAWEQNSVETAEVCIYPAWAEYNITGPIEYESLSDQNSLNIDFLDRGYNLYEEPINNHTSEIELYLLEEGLATPVYLQVQDSTGSSVPSATIKVMRYFVGQNSYLTIAKAETDSEGVATTHLRVNKIYYKYLITKDGQTLLETGRQILTCTDASCTKTFQVDPSVRLPYYDTLAGFDYDCHVNENSQGNVTSFQCTVNHQSGSMEEANLLVEKQDVVGWTEVCDITVSSTGQTMVCQFDESAEGNLYQFKLTAEKNGETFLLDSGTLDYSKGVFEDNAEFAALMIFLVFSTLGLITPKTSIAFSVAGIMFSWWLGFITVSLGAAASLVAVAVLVIMS